MTNPQQVVAVMALHYGREFMSWAIRSVIEHVDAVYVLYAAQGSHLTRTAERCPETRDELYALAKHSAGDKLHWHEGDWTQEHEQRGTIYQLTDAPVIVTLDADEIWHPGLLPAVLAFGQERNVSEIRVPFWHYYRSLTKVIKHDPAYPVRVTFRNQPKGVETFGIPADCGEAFRIHHMGYAQSSAIVRYKMLIHYHQNEFVPGYFQDVFMTNRQTDCHPCGQKEWNTEDVDILPFMQGHPYAGLEVIP